MRIPAHYSPSTSGPCNPCGRVAESACNGSGGPVSGGVVGLRVLTGKFGNSAVLAPGCKTSLPPSIAFANIGEPCLDGLRGCQRPPFRQYWRNGTFPLAFPPVETPASLAACSRVSIVSIAFVNIDEPCLDGLPFPAFFPPADRFASATGFNASASDSDRRLGALGTGVDCFKVWQFCRTFYAPAK